MTKRQPRTLTGLAIGDALGMPYEQVGHTDPFLTSWDGTFQSCPDTHPFCKDLKPGQWTDDTKMALALSNSLMCAWPEFRYSRDLASGKYLEWYRSKDWRGIGTATKTALSLLDRGVTPSGVVGAEGNGTAMRVAPLGLALHREADNVIADEAREDATITHDSDEAREGSAMVAVMVAHLVRGTKKEDLMRAASAVTNDSAVGEHLVFAHHMATKSADLPLDRKVDVLANVLGTGGHVVKTVPAALFCLLTTRSFSGAVELAVRGGGDADTTAAVTGALAGTLYGVEGTLAYCGELEAHRVLNLLDDNLFSIRGFGR